MTYVPSDLKERVTNIVEDCCAKASQHYGRPVTYPLIQYKKRGKTAGTANYNTWVLDFNPILLTENVEDFLKRTVIHEIAHLITHTIYPYASAHGQEWKNIMVFLGAEPSRCHSYDTTNSTVSNRKKYDYMCPTCTKTLQVSSILHKRMQQGQQRFHNGCGNKKPIMWVNILNKAPNTQIAANSPEIQTKTKTTMTKKDKAKIIFKQVGHIKSICIFDFITKLEMSQACANTYYSNFNPLKR